MRLRRLVSGREVERPEQEGERTQSHVTAGQVGRVVAEATALVEGTVADSVQFGWPPPPWAWINKLAHADWADICDLSIKRHRLVRVWEGAISFLAADMRALAGTPEGLVELQRGALIPLELRVLAGRVQPPESPLELVAMVRAEMDRFRLNDHDDKGQF